PIVGVELILGRRSTRPPAAGRTPGLGSYYPARRTGTRPGGDGRGRIRGRGRVPVRRPAGPDGAGGQPPRLSVGGHLVAPLRGSAPGPGRRRGGGHASGHRARLQPRPGRRGTPGRSAARRRPAGTRPGGPGPAGRLPAPPPPWLLAAVPGHPRP